MKAKKGSAKVANASKKTGVGGLASKKPKVALPKGKEKAKVSGKTGNLASKSPKKLKAKSSGPVSRNKTKVKLADYVF